MVKINIPLTVPKSREKIYTKNWELATKGTGRLFLFAGDQKIEHLNADFFGQDIPKENNDPEHLFKIAATAPIGVFAAQLGLISSYGSKYKNIPYLIKINSKTNLDSESDPYSSPLATVKEVAEFKKNSGLKIVAVGYTVYLGSKYEAKCLEEAAQIVLEAHKYGLLAVLWTYVRGKAIKNEKDIHLLAGAAGTALCLGADFAKLNYPYPNDKKLYKKVAQQFNEVTKAAGKTGIICVGGSKIKPENLLKNLYYQLNYGGTSGCAIGRNVHQYKLDKAIKMAKAISSLVYKKSDFKEAYRIFSE